MAAGVVEVGVNVNKSPQVQDAYPALEDVRARALTCRIFTPTRRRLPRPQSAPSFLSLPETRSCFLPSQPSPLSAIYSSKLIAASGSSGGSSSAIRVQVREHSSAKRPPPSARPTCPTCSGALETRQDGQSVYVARCPKCSPAEWTPRTIEGATVRARRYV